MARLTEHRALLVVILLAILVRTPLLLASTHHPDEDQFTRWAWKASESGLDVLYRTTDVNYPPLYLHVLSMTADIARAWDVPPPTAVSQARVTLFKLPAFFADLALGCLVYLAGRRWLSPHRAAGSAGLVLLNPGLVYDTAVWGQVDSVHTMLMVGGVLAALTHRPLWASAGWTLAFLTKAQSLVVLPMLALLLGRQGPSAWRLAGIGGLAAFVLVMAPLAGDPVGDVLRVYLGSVDTRPFTSSGAYNFWYLVQAARGAPGADVPDLQLALGFLSYRQLSIMLVLGWVAFVLARIARRPNDSHDASIWLGCAAISFGFFCLATQMHERYAYPAVAFMALTVWQSGRNAALFAFVSATFFLNLVLIWWGPMPTLRDAIGEPARVAVALLHVCGLAGFAWCVWSGTRPQQSGVESTSSAQPVR